MRNSQKYCRDGATISDKKVDEIVIDFDVAQVNIRASRDNEISYEYFGNEDSNFSASVDGNKLKFRDSHRKKLLNFELRTSRLELYLPSEKSYTIKASLDVSAINITDIKINDLEVRSNIDKIDIENVTVTGEMIVRSAVGAIKICDVKEPKLFRAKSSIGSIRISNLYSKDIVLSSDVGEIKFKNDDLSYKIERLDVNTSIGSQKINVGR